MHHLCGIFIVNTTHAIYTTKHHRIVHKYAIWDTTIDYIKINCEKFD